MTTGLPSDHLSTPAKWECRLPELDAVRALAVLCDALVHAVARTGGPASGADGAAPLTDVVSTARDTIVAQADGAMEAVRSILPPVMSGPFCEAVGKLLAAVEADDRAREAEEAALEERRDRQIAAWIQEHGTDDERSRWAAGTLSAWKVETMMDFKAFGFLSDLRCFQEIEDHEVRDEAEEAHGDVWEDVREIRFPSGDDHNTYEAILDAVSRRFAVPGKATVVCRAHAAGMDGSTRAVVERNSVLVTITVGEFTFERDFACPQSDAVLAILRQRLRQAA